MREMKKTFWHFLKENTIEIPIIQRDYAQGREGKEYLRRNFLSNIKVALDGNLPNREKVLKLDYVYGSIEGGKLQPLDGQQRLTTLWLLHWYIAYKAGILNDEVDEENNIEQENQERKETVSDRLKKFTYETRISSREFCGKLASFDTPQPDGIGIVEHIKNQTWFYSVWQQDPTIESMLRMLSGTKIKDKHGEDITDGLEELFDGVELATLTLYWRELTSNEDEAPIVFYYLPLKDFGLSDDLYVKMNARGKQLTPFENFKAELVDYIEQKIAKQEDGWEALSEFAQKMDTTWLDIFWKYRSSDNRVDEVYYAFINRFFWNALLSTRLDDGSYLLAKGKETGNASYNYLDKDNFNEYNDFTPYKFTDDKTLLQVFKDLEVVLDRYYEFNKNKLEIPYTKWINDFVGDAFEFIPKYSDKDKSTDLPKITSFSFRHRVLFFALCKYFKEDGEADETSLKQWMRVVCNLVSGKNRWGNTLINEISDARKAIDYIDLLKSHDVYKSLCEQEVNKNEDDFNRLWTEEIYKAQQILNSESCDLRTYDGKLEDGSKYATWEEVIIDAENYAFFDGGIRFLFCNDTDEPHWEDFDTKYSNAKKYFKKEKQTKDSDSCLNDKNNATLLKVLISKFDTGQWYNNLLCDRKIFNNWSSTWRYYLMMPYIIGPVHHFMLNNPLPLAKHEASDDIAENIIYLLSNTMLLDFVIENMPDARTHYYKGKGDNCWALYPPNQRHAPLVRLDNMLRRNSFLANNNLEADNKIPNTELYYGLYVHYDYNGKHFRWEINDYVYLMADDDKYNWSVKDEKAQEPERYYCFCATKKDDNEIKKEMEDLIKQREANAR